MPSKRKIALELFASEIYLCYGYEPYELKEQVLDKHLTLDEYPEQQMEVEAFCAQPKSSSEATTFSDGKSVVIGFFLDEVDNWLHVVELLSHELIHTTYYLLKGRGISIEADIAEVFAYTNGYLNKLCLPIVSEFYGYEVSKD